MFSTRIRTHLTYANVMASIAVFLVLGGGAYAATTLPKNSVTTVQVKDRSLLAKDFKAGQLPKGAKGDIGATGVQGVQGPAGKDGVNGTNGLNGQDGKDGKDGKDANGTVVYRRALVSVASKTSDTATATCQAGERLIGGGGGMMGILTNGIIEIYKTSYNGPSNSAGSESIDDHTTPGGWSVSGTNEDPGNSGFAVRISAYAICAS